MKNKLLLLAFPCLSCNLSAWAGEIEVEHYSANPDMQLPFSDAVRVGNMLYLSGKIGNASRAPATWLKVESAGETRQTLENIKASLEKHGSSMGEVVKCTVFLADIEEWAAMNEVYMQYFPEQAAGTQCHGRGGTGTGRPR